MGEPTQDEELERNWRDLLVSASKGALGIVPGGSVLAELITEVIPNQRMDRVIKFVRILDARLTTVEGEIRARAIQEPGFADLVEASIVQSASFDSVDRYTYLSNLIVNGIEHGGWQFLRDLHFLQVLGQLNDAEVIWLKYYSIRDFHEQKAFSERHNDVIIYSTYPAGAPRHIVEPVLTAKSYQNHLHRLGLVALKQEIRFEPQRPEPINIEERGYEINALGMHLLQRIGLA